MKDNLSPTLEEYFCPIFGFFQYTDRILNIQYKFDNNKNINELERQISIDEDNIINSIGKLAIIHSLELCSIAEIAYLISKYE
ncbi:MAG: hypothetical protein AABY10_04685 [Nanoarchaeota archaeon]